MITQSEVALLKLRELLLSGAFPPGSHLMEVPLANAMNISRTPVRAALGALAQEGLLNYTAKSGFVVRGFTVKEIVDAVSVRGRLESMACALAAANGISTESRDRLRLNLQRTDEISRKRTVKVAHVAKWCELNGEFHEVLVAEAGNQTLAKFIQQVDSVPLAAARTVAATFHNLKRIGEVISSSVTAHALVLEAVENRLPDRAEYLMREHVYQGQQGLQRYLEGIAAGGGSIRLPSSSPASAGPSNFILHCVA